MYAIKYDQIFDLLEAAIVARKERDQREAAKAQTAAIHELVDRASKRCLDGPAKTEKRGPVRTFADALLERRAYHGGCSLSRDHVDPASFQPTRRQMEALFANASPVADRAPRL